MNTLTVFRSTSHQETTPTSSITMPTHSQTREKVKVCLSIYLYVSIYLSIFSSSITMPTHSQTREKVKVCKYLSIY